jgi:hypothetical protein
MAAGRPLKEARRLAAEALALHIAGMIEDGEGIPPPSVIDDIADDPAMKNAVAFMVPINTPGDKTVRINIAARESQVQKIDAR